MSERDANQSPVLTWIQENLLVAGLVGLVLIVVLGLVLSSLLGDEDQSGIAIQDSSTTSSGNARTTTSASEDPNRPEVAQVDCGTLLTDDEVDEALFGPDPTGPRSYFTFSRGETCRHEPDDDSSSYVQIEPGDPADFADGARFSSVAGEVVRDIADVARWFDNGTDVGILSVGADIGDMSIFYRLHVGRADLDGEQRFQLARELALAAFHRFPGAPPGEPKPLVDLCQLVPDGQAEQILAEHRDAHPATRDDIFVVENFSDPVDLSEEGDASCRKLILAEIYVETQQGSPGDFEDQASMEGVVGEFVTGVGDEAVWFADVPFQGGFTAPHERSVLSVRVGEAVLRIVLAVPDTPSDEQLEVARSLAAGAISQIPGAPEPAPEIVMFDEDPPELPPQSLYELVYDGVAEGDWDEGEGLVAALEWMLDSSSDFVQEELPDGSATSLINAARAYANSDAPDSPDVRRLLDDLTSLEEAVQDSVSADTSASRLLVSAVPVAQSDPVGCPGGVDACVVEVGGEELTAIAGQRYRAFMHLPSDWGIGGFDSPAIAAFRDSIVRFLELGGMPPTRLQLAPVVGSWASYENDPGICSVVIGDNWADNQNNELLHTVARETAHCFIAHNFVQLWANPSPWLEEGLAMYLGGVVYPMVNVEHKALPGLLAQIELISTMPQRRSENWVFFEYLHSQSNAESVLNLIRQLPPGGDLAAALAGLGSIPQAYKQLARAMSDSQVPDIGGGNIPFGPSSWQVILAGPKTFDGELSRFATKRYRLEVPSDRFACGVDVTASGAEVSWRSGDPGVPGSWTEDVPDTLEGNSVLLVTSAQDDASFSFEAAKVGDNPDCEDEDENDSGNAPGPPLLCDLICDPSTYYWGDMRTVLQIERGPSDQ